MLVCSVISKPFLLAEQPLYACILLVTLIIEISNNEQARPLAALAPRHIAEITTQAIHHHLSDCSWRTLPGYSADHVFTDVGHCHALCMHIYIAIATSTPC